MLSSAREGEVLASRIIPPVHHFDMKSTDMVRLEDGCAMFLKGPEALLADAERIVMDVAVRYWNIRPAVQTASVDGSAGAEGYDIEITRERVQIAASDASGVRNAMKTLRQLAEPERGVLQFSHYLLPAVQIKDAPASSFRGIHLCWFPETPAWEMEKQIRLAAYYKFNYAIIESWGVLAYASHPECCWQEHAVTPDEIRRLVRLGKELGITLIPQVNTFGHASGARCGSGKHALLDMHPEYQSLFEPDGWTWCISNPATRAYLTDLVNETFELFEQPPFFHIGCDEAYNAGFCALCRRQDYGQLLTDHIGYFHDLFAKRGTRIMMWHDMLLNQQDERWSGYLASGEKRTEALYQTLPKDVFICYWQYGYPEINGKPPTWSPVLFLRDAGFDVLVCPWQDTRTTQSYGNLVAREALAGMLATTWNENHANNMYAIYHAAANAMWHPSATESSGIVYREYFNHHLRQVGWDMGVSRYTQTGSVQHQINPHDHQG